MFARASMRSERSSPITETWITRFRREHDIVPERVGLPSPPQPAETHLCTPTVKVTPFPRSSIDSLESFHEGYTTDWRDSCMDSSMDVMSDSNTRSPSIPAPTNSSTGCTLERGSNVSFPPSFTATNQGPRPEECALSSPMLVRPVDQGNDVVPGLTATVDRTEALQAVEIVQCYIQQQAQRYRDHLEVTLAQ